jgi:hypothetical protein
VPDQERIQNEIHRKVLEVEKGRDPKEGFPSLDFSEHSGFLVGAGKEGDPFHASIFFPETRILLQWVFPSYHHHLLKDQLYPLLESHRPQGEGEHLSWALFGIELKLPSNFKNIELNPLPGHVVLEYRNENRVHFKARRWAMPEELMGPMNLEQFSRHLSRKLLYKVSRAQLTTLGSHDAVRVEFSVKGNVGFEKIVGQWWTGEMVIWWDRKTRRLASLECYGPKRHPRVDFNRVLER